MKKITLILLLALVGCTPRTIERVVVKEVLVTPETSAPKMTLAKNVIFLIGDGMGLPQITAAMYHAGNKSVFERFRTVGLSKTHSADNLVTDSAAGATAFSTGRKTNNMFVGVCPDSIPRNTLLEEAESKGMATGMVATSTIVHATPASFISHCPNRGEYELIAEQFLDHDVDLLIGGGYKFFARRELDSRNLVAELEAKNYKVWKHFESDIADVILDQSQNQFFLTSDASPLPASQGRDYLLPAVKKAMPFLDQRNEKGFFAMFEGSQIDWGGHANNIDYVVSEMVEYEKVIAAVLDFAEKDGNTLVIVTADHETGGLTINPGSRQDSLVAGFSTPKHTASMVPVFAFGPGAELFGGVYENTAIYHKIRKAYGWE